MTQIFLQGIIIFLLLAVLPYNKPEKFTVIIGAAVFFIVEAFVLSQQTVFMKLFPPASFQHGIMAAAQFNGVSQFGDYILLYGALWIPLLVYGIGHAIIMRRSRSPLNSKEFTPARTPGRRQVVFSEAANVLSLFITGLIWFQVAFFWVVIFFAPPEMSIGFYAACGLVSLILTLLRGYITQKKSYDTFQLSLSFSLLVAFLFFLSLGVHDLSIRALAVASYVAAFYLILSRKFIERIATLDALKELTAVLFLGLVVSLPYLGSLCGTVYDVRFDSQNFLTWKYSVVQNFVPNRDIFYLYGLFTYYQHGYAVGRLLSVIYMMGLFASLYFLFKKISSSSFFAGVLVVVTILWAIGIIGHWVFFRYGTAFLFAGWFAYYLAAFRSKFRQIIMAMGALSSILFFLFTDQGIAMLLTSIVLLAVDSTLPEKGEKILLRRLLSRFGAALLFLFVGVISGAMPFLFIFFVQGSLNEFFQFFLIFSKITQYGKLPYLSTDWYNNDGVFSMVIWVGFIVVMAEYVFRRNLFRSPLAYVSLVFLSLLASVQFKNTTRPIGADLLLPGVLTFSVMVLYVLQMNMMRERRAWKSVIMTLAVVIIFFSQHADFRKTFATSFGEIKKAADNTVSVPSLDDVQACIENSIWHTTVPGDYSETLQWVMRQPDFSGKVFSYPGDPIFYVMTKQLPPPFFNGYDGTPKDAQLKNIAYLKKENVRYVIVNTESTYYMDMVPSFVRNAYISKYLFTHYAAIKREGRFVVMRRNDLPVDMWNNQITYEVLYSDMTNLDLGNIPKSEGSRFTRVLGRSYVVVTKGSLEDINRYLGERPLHSSGLAVMSLREQRGAKSNLEISADNGMTTRVMFNACDSGEKCFVRLERLPLFYSDRRVVTITSSDNGHGIYELILFSDNDDLW